MASRIVVAATSTADAQHLWELVSDVENWPRHLEIYSSITALQPGPTREGSRFRVRRPGVGAAVFEVERWWEGVGFVWHTRGPGLVSVVEHEISPLREGARLELTCTWHGPLAPAARRLLARRARELLDLEAETFTWLAGTNQEING